MEGCSPDKGHTLEIEMASNFIEKILSFNDPRELKEWAIIHNKLFDVDVRNILMQLERSIKVCGTKVSVIYSFVSLKYHVICVYLLRTYCKND